MQFCFVLVEPAVPENIGAAARAINTMGFSELRLVKPANHLADEAKWLAHGSVDILNRAKLFKSFKNAINDLDFVVGTTAKNRSTKHDYFAPEKAKEIIENKGKSASRIGIVFGREESGLTNEELSLCDIASTIQLSKPYPSINLAQSVMLYAYVFSPYNQNNLYENPFSGEGERIYSEMKVNATGILKKLNIKEDSILYHRIMERIATSNEDDVRLFLSFAKKFHQKFD